MTEPSDTELFESIPRRAISKLPYSLRSVATPRCGVPVRVEQTESVHQGLSLRR